MWLTFLNKHFYTCLQTSAESLIVVFLKMSDFSLDLSVFYALPNNFTSNHLGKKEYPKSEKSQSPDPVLYIFPSDFDEVAGSK